MRVDRIASDRFTGYQWRLFVFLSVATFFEGYDFIALTQILPNLREDFGLSKGFAGVMVGFINLGTVLAYLVVRRADRWGRRRVLSLTIAGYTLFTVLSGLAPDPYSFAAFQFLARVFLIGEWAISMVYAAEEFPAARRGMVIGVISACATLGSVTCAAVVPLLLQTPWGWRSVYFVGVVPLLLLAFARRNLKETSRFAAEAARTGPKAPPRRFAHILSTPYRRRVLRLALIWGLTYICFHTMVTFWKDFAVNERGLSDGEVGRAIAIAALAAMPLTFLAGPLLDRLGRRGGALVIYGLGAAGGLGCYTLVGAWPLTGALVFGVFGAAATPTVLNAFTTELFPTDLRADAFAWANNLLGRIGYVLAPIGVGLVAQEIGWGPSIRGLLVFPLLALVFLWVWLPETRGRELEETSAL